MPKLPPSIQNIKITADHLLGILIMGTTGGVIGFYLDSTILIASGAILGSFLGGFVTTLGARLFFLSILTGTFLGGSLFALSQGSEWFMIGAGSGGAIGGFVGINIQLFLKK